MRRKPNAAGARARLGAPRSAAPAPIRRPTGPLCKPRPTPSPTRCLLRCSKI
jgi:hypothetical protein